MKELTIYPVLLGEAERSVRNLKKGLKVLDLSPEKQTWINFLRTSENSSTPIEIDEIHTAYDKMKITTGSAAYRNYEEAARKMEKLKAIDIENAKNEGKEKGREEGLKEGKEEGLAEGEHRKALETAKKMLADGLSIDIVAKYTGLSNDILCNLQVIK